MPRRRSPAFRFVAYLAAVSGLAAQPKSVYIGAEMCGNCHPVQFARQSASAHASALSRTPEHRLVASFSTSAPLTRMPVYRFEFSLRGGELRTRISDKVDVMDLPLEWAFGAGRQAVTFVSRVDKDWYVEHYATWYPALRAWGATPGQSELQPATLPQAAGRIYSVSDPQAGIAGCFECHSTGAVTFGDAGEARLAEPGVHCETCHGPGAAHAADPARTTIRNPGKLSARQLNELCGTCHRSPPPNGQTVDWNSAWNVRHQPVYLNESACFRKSRGALTCLTCHDPHEPAEKKTSAFYNSRCMECHGNSAPAPKPVCLAQMPANCVDCHMPLVSPQAPLRFTNHWIGVYAGGAKLKPVR